MSVYPQLSCQKYQTQISRAELLGWVRAMVGADSKYEMNVNNFTTGVFCGGIGYVSQGTGNAEILCSTDWNDGKVACAIVDAIEPGAIRALEQSVRTDLDLRGFFPTTSTGNGWRRRLGQLPKGTGHWRATRHSACCSRKGLQRRARV